MVAWKIYLKQRYGKLSKVADAIGCSYSRLCAMRELPAHRVGQLVAMGLSKQKLTDNTDLRKKLNNKKGNKND